MLITAPIILILAGQYRRDKLLLNYYLIHSLSIMILLFRIVFKFLGYNLLFLQLYLIYLTITPWLQIQAFLSKFTTHPLTIIGIILPPENNFSFRPD